MLLVCVDEHLSHAPDDQRLPISVHRLFRRRNLQLVPPILHTANPQVINIHRVVTPVSDHHRLDLIYNIVNWITSNNPSGQLEPGINIAPYQDNIETIPRQHRDNTETTSWQHRTVSKTKMNDWITEYWSRSHILCSKKTDSKFPNQLETQSETVDYPITKLSPASSNQLKTVSRAIIHKRVWSIWNFFLNAKLGCAIPSSIPCPANEIYQVEIQ